MNNESSFDITTQETNPVQTVAPTKEDNDMLRATEKITALYCRLSVEDKDEKKNGKEDPSNSIQHQQDMLLAYAKSNHFPHPTVFIDATDIIGLKQNPTNGRRFSPIFSFIGHFRYKTRKCYF